ncbi:hypothetical protein GCM10028819_07920 [Spirosoma humi]
MESPTNSQLIDADEQLATVISHFYCVEHTTQAAPVCQQLLPNYEMLLVFNFGPTIPISLGEASYVIEQTAVLGPLQKTLVYELPPGADLIVVNFTLNGFYRLLGVPMHQLKADDLHNPDLLLNKACFSELWAQLAPMRVLADRIRLLRDYAMAFVAPSDAAALSLLDSIPFFRDSSTDPIKILAQTHKLSTRSIQLRFQTYLGYSAKEMIRFLRFKKVLSHLCQQYPATPDWLELVVMFGYHDHSHLIKDFTYFLGLTPRQFFKQLAAGGVCISKSGKFY